MITIGELLVQAEQTCKEQNKDGHPARLLLMHLLNIASYELYAKQQDEITLEQQEQFWQQFQRYVEDNEPIQYIIGYEYFAGRNLVVTPDVLIPRPETEELVYELLFLIDEYFGVEQGYDILQVADIGTGSGAIAISIAAEEPRVQMYATDISDVALNIARQNATLYASSVQLLQGDMVQPLIDEKISLDILISNPPYIPLKQDVQSIVKNNEPNIALFGGEDGLYFYRQILTQAAQILNPKQYLLAFEIGFDQKEALTQLAMHTFPQAEITLKQDLQGKDRMLFIYYNQNAPTVRED